MILRALTVVLPVVLLAGCASKSHQVLESANDKSLQSLEHATKDIQRQWGVTSRLSSLRFQEPHSGLDLARVDDPMRRIITFPGGYNGTLEKLIEELASVTGYQYLRPAGKYPARDVPVVFAEEFRTIAEYIYDAGVQAGSRATVVLDMKNRSLHITYSGY